MNSDVQLGLQDGNKRSGEDELAAPWTIDTQIAAASVTRFRFANRTFSHGRFVVFPPARLAANTLLRICLHPLTPTQFR
jgi:hypothetical protein